MEKKSHLTNEVLTKKFKSNFELVNYAIKLAENMIKTGRDARVKSDIQNRAMLVLEEIDEGKDQFDQIPERQREAQGQMNGEEIITEEVLMNERVVERRKARFSMSDEK